MTLPRCVDWLDVAGGLLLGMALGPTLLYIAAGFFVGRTKR